MTPAAADQVAELVEEAPRLAGDGDAAAAVALAEANDGSSVDTAVIAQNLAMTFKYTGRFDEAACLFQRSMAIAERLGDRRLVAVICHNLGGLAHARGDHETGIPWARRSVREREPLDDPLGLAADRGALAGLLIDAGHLDEAIQLLDATRQVFVEHLGDDHHEVAVVDGNLAAVALATDDLPAADRHARAALHVKERHLGPDHPELAVTLTTLGTILRRRGENGRRRGCTDGRSPCSAHRSTRATPLLRTIEDNLETANVTRQRLKETPR